MAKVAVVGCGIIGLTSAIKLQEAGHRVTIVAAELPPCTTSNKAAAIWEPYLAEPKDRVRSWAMVTYDHFVAEYGEPRAGVMEVELTHVSRETIEEQPLWVHDRHHFRRLAQAELPPGHVGGFVVKVPFIPSGQYLGYLLERFADAGGDVQLRHLRDFADLGSRFVAIVNCSGLGARELVGDAEMRPIRGQLAIVRRPAAVRHVVDDVSFPGQPVYVMPRGDEVVLGGTAQDGDGNLDEDLATRRLVLERCLEIEPALAGATFLRPVVGLRPFRPAVRLETERAHSGPPVIHNYGHGGSGFTLSWGCAQEVVERMGEAV